MEQRYRPNEFQLLTDDALEKFGELIRKWATDKKAQRPGSREDFIKALTGADISPNDYYLDKEISRIEFFERSRESLSFLLPLDERVDWGNNGDEAAPQLDYTIPAFYIDLELERYNGRARIKGIAGVKEAKQMDNLRLGDYCSAQCM